MARTDSARPDEPPKPGPLPDGTVLAGRRRTFGRRRRWRYRWDLRSRFDRGRTGSTSPSIQVDRRGYDGDYDHGTDRGDEGPVHGESRHDGARLADRNGVRGRAARQVPGPAGEDPEDRGRDRGQIHAIPREHVDDLARARGHAAGGRIRRVDDGSSRTHVDRQRILDLVAE